jgi:hypothetical protein
VDEVNQAIILRIAGECSNRTPRDLMKPFTGDILHAMQVRVAPLWARRWLR